MACCSPSCFPMTAKAKSPSPPFSGAVPVSSVSCTNYYSSRSTSRASRLIQSSLHSTYYYSYSTPSLHETLVRRPRFSTRPSSFLVISLFPALHLFSTSLYQQILAVFVNHKTWVNFLFNFDFIVYVPGFLVIKLKLWILCEFLMVQVLLVLHLFFLSYFLRLGRLCHQAIS